jgi:hypothetical protein
MTEQSLTTAELQNFIDNLLSDSDPQLDALNQTLD